MSTPIQLQDLINASEDVATISAVANGPESGAGSTVTARLGGTIQTLAAAIAAVIASTVGNYQGTYSAGTTYTKGMIALYSGSSYISLLNGNVANEPDTSPTQWGLVAAGGTLSSTIATLLTCQAGINVTSGNVSAPTATIPTLNGDVQALGMLLDSQMLPLPYPNNLSLIRAWCDASGKVIFGFGPDGTISSTWLANNFFAKPTGATINGADISFSGFVSDEQLVQLGYPNNLGVVKAIVDSGQRLIFGWNLDGSVQSTGFMSQLASIIGSNPDVLSRALNEDETFGTLYTQVDGSSHTQIWRADTLFKTSTQLTTSGNNQQPAMSQNGHYITFLSDRDVPGTFVVYRMGRYGENQMPLSVDIPAAVSLNSVHVIGQSLGAGQAPGRQTAVTTVQPFVNIMPNGGVRMGQPTDAAINLATNFSSFVPLIGDVVLPNLGETVANGCVDRTTNELLIKDGIASKHLVTVLANPGEAYSNMAKGTQCYTNAIAAITQAKTLATAASLTYAVRAMPVLHGEADGHNLNTNYWQNLLTWQANYEADIQSITGQKLSVPFMIQQLATGSSTNSNQTQSIIMMQQVRAWKMNPGKILLAYCPYFMQHSPDDEHLSSAGYRLAGEYFAKVYRKIMKGEYWMPFYPKWNRISKVGKTLTVPFWVPEPPLVLDTQTIVQQAYVSGGLNGFEVYDSSNNPIAISSMSIVGQNKDTVQLNLATDPGGGASVAYAFTAPIGTQGGPGLGCGPKGNLRDSSKEMSYYPYSQDRTAAWVTSAANYPNPPYPDGVSVPLWNWALSFHEPVAISY